MGPTHTDHWRQGGVLAGRGAARLVWQHRRAMTDALRTPDHPPLPVARSQPKPDLHKARNMRRDAYKSLSADFMVSQLQACPAGSDRCCMHAHRAELPPRPATRPPPSSCAPALAPADAPLESHNV
jgi:hypothetical protein